MGMAASQARLLSLQARQSNLEYQGQQINQERTILSQQCTALYNSLLAMQVPTPPSTNDFTSVKYEGINGATKYSFDASSVKPGKDGAYTLTLGTIDYGASLTKNNGYVTTSPGTEVLNGKTISTNDTRQVSTGNYIFHEVAEGATPDTFLIKVDNPEETDNLYVLDGDKYIPASGDVEEDKYYFRLNTKDSDEYKNDTGYVAVTEETTNEPITYNYTRADLVNLYIIEDGVARKVDPTSSQDVTKNVDGTYSLIEGATYFVKGVGDEKINTPSTGAAGAEYGDQTIAGYQAMTLDYAKDNGYITQDQYDGYCNAIRNAAISLAGEDDVCEPEDFLIYLDGSGTPHFALASDITDGSAITYNFIANGEYTKNTQYDNCNLTFDPATGRITAMDIPATTDDKGNPLTFTTISVSAATVTDENAYQDAYAQYEYEQYLYDKKQQEINAKTEVIQQQDRNLELKLQRLDNERQQIKTEIDAVDKVIDENIEKSYKTFSG